MLELHGIKVEDDSKVRGNEECEVSERAERTNPQQLASSCYFLSKGNSGMHKEKQIRELENVIVTFASLSLIEILRAEK